MPYYPPFLFPFYNNRNFNNQYSNPLNQMDKPLSSYKNEKKFNNNYNTVCPNEEKDSEDTGSSEPVFELFGLNLYFDDILLICILFFLYSEKVKNEELFICLLLLLLT